MTTLYKTVVTKSGHFHLCGNVDFFSKFQHNQGKPQEYICTSDNDLKQEPGLCHFQHNLTLKPLHNLSKLTVYARKLGKLLKPEVGRGRNFAQSQIKKILPYKEALAPICADWD